MSTVIAPAVHAAFFRALSETDEDTAVRIALSLVDAGRAVPEVLCGLVAPAQRRVGALWARNRWSVAREHAATYICDRVIGALARRVPSGRPPRGVVLVACADGDWHALPARIVAETLRVDGWMVTFLGASVPAEHLARFVHEAGPDAVALSCSIATSLPHARAMIEATRQTGVPVLAGGPGFGPDGVWALRLGADAWAPDAPGAATRLAHDWPAHTGPAPELGHLSDDEHARLAGVRGTVVNAAMAELTSHGVITHYTGRQLAATCDDLGHIIDFLVAALLVDDGSLVESFTRWLVEILRVRGVPPATIAAGYDALGCALTGFPRAAHLLGAGRALLP